MMRGMALAEADWISFDRSHACRGRLQIPDRYRLIEALDPTLTRIARGSGVSYVAASFGAGAVVQDMRSFNRLLAYDAERCLLSVEAGALIGDVMAWALARGLYLPVAPGHPRATVGGCIAADVHGKNPARDGTFLRQVESLELYHPARGWLRVDREQHAELFLASFAGFGLSGTIVSAQLRLAAAPASHIALRRVAVPDLLAAQSILREHHDATLLYGWHDGMAKGQAFGRGFVQVGTPISAGASALAAAIGDLPARIAPWPLRFWRGVNTRLVNRGLHAVWKRQAERTLPLAQALFPLARAQRYFAAYGRPGFCEIQLLVGHDRYAAFVAELTELCAKHRPALPLISSKLFDGAASGLRFDGHGIALSVQLPRAERGFAEALRELGVRHQGRPNLIKDSGLDVNQVAAVIPDLAEQQTLYARVNPGQVYRSALAERLWL